MTKRRKMKRPAHCYWCKRQLEPSWSQGQCAFTKDHIVPQSEGGKKWLPCCRACNTMKADMSPERWREFMADFPRWWQHYPMTAAVIIQKSRML